MTAGRPVGKKIRELCEHLDAHGPMETSSLRKLMPSVELSNLGKYCSRGVGLGLMTVTRVKIPKGNQNTWAVVPGWREMIEQRRTTRIRPIEPKPVRRTGWTGVSSVFQMGANL